MSLLPFLRARTLRRKCFRFDLFLMNLISICRKVSISEGKFVLFTVLCKTIDFPLATGSARKICGGALGDENLIVGDIVAAREVRRLKLSGKIARIDLKNLLAFHRYRGDLSSLRRETAERG